MWPFRKKRPPESEEQSRRQMERAEHAVETSEAALEASKESREDVMALIISLRAHRKANSWTEQIENVLGGPKA